MALATFCYLVERVHGPREGGTRRGHDRHGYYACGGVSCQRIFQRAGAHAAPAVDGDGPDGVAAETADLHGADHGVVRLLGAVNCGPARADALHAAPGESAFARREEGGQVRGHAAAGEGAFGVREPDEVRDPAQSLLLYEVGPAGADGEVRVVGGEEGGGEDTYLQARGADVAEVERSGGRDAGVEDACGVGQDPVGVAGLLGQRGFEAPDQHLVQLWLRGPRRVERLPRLADHAFEILQYPLAVGERGKVGLLVLRHGAHPRPVPLLAHVPLFLGARAAADALVDLGTVALQEGADDQADDAAPEEDDGQYDGHGVDGRVGEAGDQDVEVGDAEHEQNEQQDAGDRRRPGGRHSEDEYDAERQDGLRHRGGPG